MDPVHALRIVGGAARWAELISMGVGRRSLARATRTHTVVRRLYGTYALPETPEPVWLAAAFHATLSCVSLCEAAGLPLLVRPKVAHVLVPADRGLAERDLRPTSRVKFHRTDRATAYPFANPLATAIDLAAECVDRFAQAALVDAALGARRIDPANLRDFQFTSATRRKWLIDHCDPEAQSIMESYARLRLTEAGFAVQPQKVVGGSGHRDLLVDRLVVVELDSWKHHGNRVKFREDRMWDRNAIHAGALTLRYTFADLFGSNPADIVADVEAALLLLRKGA